MVLLKALLVGINSYPLKPLRGCANDVLQMKSLLVNCCGFAEENLRILLDQDAKREAICAGLAWLAQEDWGEAQDLASLRVFHFSGHGSYTADQNGDEPDGRDECLAPVDHLDAGLLTDDALKELYDRFPPAGNLTLVMDCCHAGSIDKEAGRDVVTRFIPISLEEQGRIDAAARLFGQAQRQFVVQEIRRLRHIGLPEDELDRQVPELVDTFQKQRFGDLRLREGNVLLAACRADQQAADARLAGDYHGAFTYCLVEAITEAGGFLPYGDLLKRAAQKMSSLGFRQVPQLECAGGHDRQRAFQPFS